MCFKLLLEPQLQSPLTIALLPLIREEDVTLLNMAALLIYTGMKNQAKSGQATSLKKRQFSSRQLL